MFGLGREQQMKFSNPGINNGKQPLAEASGFLYILGFGHMKKP